MARTTVQVLLLGTLAAAVLVVLFRMGLPPSGMAFAVAAAVDPDA